ncbi:MAG TPA: hypothetical protein VNX26_16980 [Candidatus Acidoferrum sp.]|jgi:hypothetical protein|nr:hypothetical protein [Candidatus Acidoferrum sp.]
MSVRNGIVLFLALSTLALLLACGGYSSPKVQPPPSGGFSNSNLNGTYVFSSTGSDFNGGFLATAGALVANGSGTITGGTMDLVGTNVIQSGTVAQSITGSYSVGVDGRGQATVISSAGTIKFDFVLTSSSHGLITEFDGNGSGSGTLDLQTAVTSLSQLQGPYAFSLSGVDATGNADATAGAFTLDGAGNITVGVQDFNDNGLPYLNLTVTPVNPAVLGTGTGPGTIKLNTSTFNTLTFDFYPIDATRWKLIETDTSPILVGDVSTQTGASIPTGQMVFTMAGVDSFGPVAAGGVMTSDGTGNFTAGLEDLNDAGTVSQAQLSFTGTAVAGGPGVGGRLIVNLAGFSPATQIVIYPSSEGLLTLETDTAALAAGAAFAQKSTTLAASQGYGLNLSAINIPGNFAAPFEEDDIAEFVTTSSGFSGIVDLNDQGSPTFKQKFTGTYPFAIDSTGRGGANTNYFNYYFYDVDGSTFLLLEVDSNQIGVGTFQLQTTPAAGAAQPAIPMFRPAVRTHAALRRKQ